MMTKIIATCSFAFRQQAMSAPSRPLKLLQWYYRQVEKRPVITQSLMASSMWMLGDAIAQNFEMRRKTEKQAATFNYSRTLKMGLIGLCWNGPFSSVWLRFLDRRFGTSGASKVVFKKLAADQILQNPVLTGGIIFLVGVSNQLSVEKSANVVKEELLSVMYRGWVYWVMVQIVNFKYTPLNYRLLVIQCASIIWNCYLSMRSNMAVEETGKVLEIESSDKKEE